MTQIRPAEYAGIALVALIVLAGAGAPLLTRYAPDFQISGGTLLPASGAHPFGTDDLGRDLFSRVLYGIRVDIVVSAAGVPVALVLGTVLGLCAPLSRAGDVVVQRAFDVILAFPILILGIAIAVITSPGLAAIGTTVALANVPIFGRLARAAVITQRERDYVAAAQAIGAGPLRILVRHILPNSVDALIVQAALSLATAVFVEGGMSFVGVGIRVPAPSLGNILNESLPYLASNPNFALGPMIVFTALVLGLNLIADSLNARLSHR
jgi:peptide/nickel transport system permease protein